MDQKNFTIQLNADKKQVCNESDTARILEIRLQTPLAPQKDSRPKLNLAMVLDRSGSMQYAKLEYVKQAACHVLDQLTEQDQVALVVYDDTIQVLAHSMAITKDNRIELKQRISGLRAGNMTNLCDGWLTGCREIACSAQDGMVNRTLLLTDGLANVGQTDPEILAQHALELYKDSISTSSFGVGEGFNEHLLEAMANRGGGNFYFIAKPDQITNIFLHEFKDLVGIAVRKAEIKLALPPSVKWHVLGGWPAEYKDGYLHIYVGDLFAGKLQDIYLRLQIPKNEKDSDLSCEVKAFAIGADGYILEDQSRMVFQYTVQSEVEAEPVNRELMERFSVVELADEATQSLKLEREGRREEAQRRMVSSINRNMPFIGTQVASNYKNMAERMKNGMTEADRKQSHWETYQIKRQKEKEKGENQ